MEIKDSLPPPRRGRELVYPFDKLNAGQSLTIGEFTKNKRASVLTSAKQWFARNGIKARLTTRNENGVLYLYRTA